MDNGASAGGRHGADTGTADADGTLCATRHGRPRQSAAPARGEASADIQFFVISYKSRCPERLSASAAVADHVADERAGPRRTTQDTRWLNGVNRQLLYSFSARRRAGFIAHRPL